MQSGLAIHQHHISIHQMAPYFLRIGRQQGLGRGRAIAIRAARHGSRQGSLGAYGH